MIMYFRKKNPHKIIKKQRSKNKTTKTNKQTNKQTKIKQNRLGRVNCA
jgi:hypothetical protein